MYFLTSFYNLFTSTGFLTLCMMLMVGYLLQGKELIKGDIVGKSDPYAVIKHGSQKYTTKVGLFKQTERMTDRHLYSKTERQTDRQKNR